MIEEPPLLTINGNRRRPTEAQIAAFQGVPTGFVVDAMYGDGALDMAIKPLVPELGRVAGPALTADAGPADIMATLAALAFVQKGDVAIVAFGGHQGCAAVGDRVSGMFLNAGAAGLVTDGPARDIEGITEVGLPVWCTGLTPASPYTNGPGKVGFPVQMGGRRIQNGDMIIADRDGVVVVPFENIDEVIIRLGRVEQAEAALDAKVAEGLKVPYAITELLESDRTVITD